MVRKTLTSMNPGEASALRAAVFDLSEKGSKQMLYSMIIILSQNSSVMLGQFRNVLDDARKYSQVK